MNIQRECKLHRVGRSIRLNLPADIVRLFGLEEHDDCLLDIDATSITLRFYKSTTTVVRTPILAVEPEAEEQQVEAVVEEAAEAAA